VKPRAPGPILAYHSIDDTGSFMSVSSAAFRLQMARLRDWGYRGVSLGEWLRAPAVGAPKTVAITFDDGYRNNYEQAFPILEEFGFQATVFLATAFMGKENTWMKESQGPRLPMLSWDQAARMLDYGVEFQSHSNTHPDLSTQPPDAVREELRSSQEAIARRLGTAPDLFCYPFGRFNETVVDVLRGEGVRAAVTTRFGWNTPSPTPYALERIVSRWFRGRPWAFALFVRGAGSRVLLRAARAYARRRRP